MRLLLIEDEVEMGAALSAALSRFGALVNHACTCTEGMEASRCSAYDIILLDRLLPDGDGLDCIPQLRSAAPGVPIIVLTSRREAEDRVTGLNRGADDYMGKPFSLDELVARIRAVLRRPGALSRQIIQLGKLEFDFINMQATVNAARLELRRREMLALSALLKRPGKVVLRAVLEESVFGYDDNVQSNTIEAHISRLRRKLDEASSGIEIRGVRGVGYLIQAADADA